jgi:hypothetical protein
MPHSLLAHLRTVRVPTNTIEYTLEVLRAFGRYEVEGLVLWLADVLGDEAEVRDVFVPEQHALESEDGLGYFVDGDVLFRLNQDLAATGLRLIAQVHSHPTRAYHSAADDRYAIVTADGGFSLVVPNFGVAPPTLTEWAVYRLDKTSWRELSPVEVTGIFEVTD